MEILVRWNTLSNRMIPNLICLTDFIHWEVKVNKIEKVPEHGKRIEIYYFNCNFKKISNSLPQKLHALLLCISSKTIGKTKLLMSSIWRIALVKSCMAYRRCGHFESRVIEQMASRNCRNGSRKPKSECIAVAAFLLITQALMSEFLDLKEFWYSMFLTRKF